MGGATYYAKACDSTGCGNQISFTMATITPVPTSSFDAGYNGIVSTHWGITSLPMYLLLAYTRSVPATIIWGIIFGAIICGFFRKTKSVRLISILMLVLSPLIMSSSTGLMLGMPLVMQSMGAVMFAAGLAGIGLSFVKK